MELKGYGPIIIIIAVLAILATAQGLYGGAVQPDMLQSQVSGTGTSLEEIRRFDLEIELNDDREIEIRYQTQGEETQAQVRRGDQNGETLSGEEATRSVQTIIESAPSLTNTEPLTIIQGILDQLGVHQANVKEFDLEYTLADGMERTIELEVDKDRDDDDERDD